MNRGQGKLAGSINDFNYYRKLADGYMPLFFTLQQDSHWAYSWLMHKVGSFLEGNISYVNLLCFVSPRSQHKKLQGCSCIFGQTCGGFIHTEWRNRLWFLPAALWRFPVHMFQVTFTRLTTNSADTSVLECTCPSYCQSLWNLRKMNGHLF